MTRGHDDPTWASAKPPPTSDQHFEDSRDLEFSDFGRDPRYPPVWWLLPILAVGGITAAVLIAKFIL
jgi:hypothetical protein